MSQALTVMPFGEWEGRGFEEIPTDALRGLLERYAASVDKPFVERVYNRLADELIRRLGRKPGRRRRARGRSGSSGRPRNLGADVRPAVLDAG